MNVYNQDIIAAIVSGKILQYQKNVIEHLATDSRKIILPESSLFFCLVTEKRNGHQFLSEAYKKGVRQFIVCENIDIEKFSEAGFILVENSLAALQALAAFHRKQFHYPVIGITGSNGKTIVKEWLYQLLNDSYKIVRSPKSYNSQIGVPLSVWQMQTHHTLGIFEAGISTINEMEKLQNIIEPTIGVLTHIGDAHNEGFESTQQKFDEKCKLFKHCKKIVVNADTLLLLQHSFKKENLFTWSRTHEADLQILSIEKNFSNTYIKGFYKTQFLEIQIPFTDDASIENAITCWCVLLLINQPFETIKKNIEQLHAISMRLEMKQGNHHCTVINDSYSADFSSFEIALNFLSQQKQHPNKTIIVSDFLQAGNEELLYKKIADSIQSHSINKIICIGSKIKLIEKYLDDKKIQLHFFETTNAFLSAFNQIKFYNEAILLKGARIYEFERISRLLEKKIHQTLLEINLTAIAHNLNYFRSLLKKETKIMAMVKAFSYGSGSFEIANLLQYCGVDYLAVAYADEGVELRQAGISMPIMVMNPEENNWNTLVNFQLEPEIYSFKTFLSFQHYLQNEGIEYYPIHIKIDTGMHRLGFTYDEIDKLCSLLYKNEKFSVRSVFSHLVASEDATHDEFTQHQARLFEKASGQLQSVLNYSFIRHICNSAGIIRHPHLQMEMVRIGIGLYGIGSNNEFLQNVSTLKTTIAQIKQVKKGETIGYSRKGIAKNDITIATVRIGYADGYPRSLSNGIGKMLVQNQWAPTVGNISMDMTMIDITGIKNVQEGDEVIVFGKNLSISQIAEWCHTIPYEILTGIGSRVKRIYFEE